MDESLGANSVVLPNSRETVKIGSKMEPITAPLSLGNVGIIETDGASFPRAPSFLKRPREEGGETSEGKMRRRRDGRMEGFAREFPATSDRVIIRGVRHGTEKRKSSNLCSTHSLRPLLTIFAIVLRSTRYPLDETGSFSLRYSGRYD